MARTNNRKVIPLREDIVAQETGRVGGSARAYQAGGPRIFPVVTTMPRLPVMIPDEIIDYYGWVFCQGGFLNLQMTFEQFLAVVAAISPAGLSPEYEDSEAILAND